MDVDNFEEEWRTVILDKGRHNINNKYEVSSFGRVRDTTHNNKIIPIFDSNKKNRKGQHWKRVSLYFNKDTYFKISVHRLVALAFLGNPPEKDSQVNHKDGNPENNYYGNLEWVTMSENMQHAFDNNLVTVHIGENRSNSIFTEDDVRAICYLMEKGYKAKAIYEILFDNMMTYNTEITRSRINNLMKHIRKKTHWKHISVHYNI